MSETTMFVIAETIIVLMAVVAAWFAQARVIARLETKVDALHEGHKVIVSDIKELSDSREITDRNVAKIAQHLKSTGHNGDIELEH